MVGAIAMFWRMLATVRLAREMASGNLSRLSPIRAMSEVSTATADPAAPIAHADVLGCHLQNWPGKEGARQSALRHIALPRHTAAPRVPSGTRSSLAMMALSAISMGSGRTSVQHAVMLSKPISWLVRANVDRSLRSSSR